MSEKDNPHTIRRDACQIVYWKGNVAAGVNDEDKDRASLMALSPQGWWVIEDFKLPKDQMRLLKWESALTSAYEKGRRDKAQEVIDVLGIKERRD